MRKAIVLAVAVISILGVSSCGMGSFGTTDTTQAQSSQSQLGALGSILSNATGIGNVLSGVLGVTTTDIVGTWVYQEPAVLFESDNLLTKAGGQLAAQKLESKVNTYFQKAGIVPGKVTMTFDKNGNFTQTIGSKQQGGTYQITNGNVNLTYTGGTSQIVGTTQLSGNNLVIVVDMTKLMNLATTISAASNNATLQGISSIASGVSGMKAGLKFTKK